MHSNERVPFEASHPATRLVRSSVEANVVSDGSLAMLLTLNPQTIVS